MKEKNKKGITLIALVVTIVVLLILAGITINLLFSNGGIFDIVNQAKIEYEIGALKDRINNVIADWSIERAVDSSITVDDLWDKMVDADIIDNPDEDVSGPTKDGENDRYELTTNEGYIVEIIISPDGNVSIGDVVKGDKLPPKIGEITATIQSNSIHIEVEITRSEGEVSLSYYYKKDGEPDSSYQTLKEGVKELTADFTGLEQQKVYNIKVVVKDENGTSEKVINVTTGELTGTVTQKGETAWNNGTATIELETKETGVTIQYQIGGTEGEWLDYKGPITGLNHGQTVYAVTTDGTNQSGYSSIDILDQINPQNAQIELSETSTTTTGNITATVTHIDNESGVELTKCKWIYNTDQNPIGTEEDSYSNTFSDSQPIILSVTTPGTYYLHVLTQDKAGNKIETISNPITINQLITQLTLDHTELTLEEGQSSTLTAQILPENATNKTLSWESNNTAVATVENGTIYAVQAGNAVITAKTTDGSNLTATCNITVNKPLPTVKDTLKEGQYVQYIDKSGIPRKCIVIYDSTSGYGTQIVTESGVDSVTIGVEDDLKTSIEEYNNAVNALNTKAREYLNTDYASSARCLGSNPINPAAQSGYYRDKNFDFSEYNGKLRNGDENYVSDLEKIKSYNSSCRNVWLASRYVAYSEDSGRITFYISSVGTSSSKYTVNEICIFGSSISDYSKSETMGICPVFTLKDNVKINGGSGTSGDPYTLTI